MQVNCTDRRGNKQHFGARVYEAARNFLTGFQLEVKAPEKYLREALRDIYESFFFTGGLQGGVPMTICFMADAFGDTRQRSHRNNTFLHVCGVL